ncbi:hypothetical protein [Roseovarius sp. MBR-6]|jgi:hypothetical protein|uniref:hypothetical protein n=1 Tax=Roseovarius sp. MBR-6 TaxID=3156459 RepID=UPI00339970A7
MSRIKVEVVSRKAPRPRRRKRHFGQRMQALGGRRSMGARIVGAARWLMKPRALTWIAAALATVTVTFGTPHVLVTYRCNGVGTQATRCFECRYVGVQGMREYLGPQWNCPLVTMLPVNWSALIVKVTG